jgi:hypothetical protein
MADEIYPIRVGDPPPVDPADRRRMKKLILAARDLAQKSKKIDLQLERLIEKYEPSEMDQYGEFGDWSGDAACEIRDLCYNSTGKEWKAIVAQMDEMIDDLFSIEEGDRANG